MENIIIFLVLELVSVLLIKGLIESLMLECKYNKKIKWMSYLGMYLLAVFSYMVFGTSLLNSLIVSSLILLVMASLYRKHTLYDLIFRFFITEGVILSLDIIVYKYIMPLIKNGLSFEISYFIYLVLLMGISFIINLLKIKNIEIKRNKVSYFLLSILVAQYIVFMLSGKDLMENLPFLLSMLVILILIVCLFKAYYDYDEMVGEIYKEDKKTD